MKIIKTLPIPGIMYPPFKTLITFTRLLNNHWDHENTFENPNNFHYSRFNVVLTGWWSVWECGPSLINLFPSASATWSLSHAQSNHNLHGPPNTALLCSLCYSLLMSLDPHLPSGFSFSTSPPYDLYTSWVPWRSATQAAVSLGLVTHRQR